MEDGRKGREWKSYKVFKMSHKVGKENIGILGEGGKEIN